MQHLHFEYLDPSGLPIDPGQCFSNGGGCGSCPPPGSGGGNSASSYGDTHLRTADGLAYDFQAVGDFVLSKSTDGNDDFEVQTRQQQWSGNRSAAVNIGAAVRVHGDVINIYPASGGFDLVINDEVLPSTATLNRQLPGGGTIKVGSGSAAVSWPDGTMLTLDFGNQGTGTARLLLAPSRRGKVEGLLGNDDGNSANDLRMRNGALVSADQHELYHEYRDSWHIALGSPESLFRRGPDLWDPSFPNSIVTLGSLDPTAVEGARGTCRSAGVVHPEVVDACAFDIVVTGQTFWAAEEVKVDPAILAVTVAPALSYLTPGDTRQFAAAVSGTTNHAVTWTATGGSIGVTGESSMTYTAPAAPGTYAITARSAANGSAVSSATVIVTPVLIPYAAARYRYLVGPAGHTSGFEKAKFDDSAWSAGSAPFGSGASCSIAATVRTPWNNSPPPTDLLFRTTFQLSASSLVDLEIGVAIDNDIQIFVNGTDVTRAASGYSPSSGFVGHEGCASQESIVVPVPRSILQVGANTLAVRARDRGGDAFVDLQVRVAPLPR